MKRTETQFDNPAVRARMERSFFGALLLQSLASEALERQKTEDLEKQKEEEKSHE